MIVALRTDQTTLLVNRKACEVLGYAENELIGMKWFERVLPEGERGSMQAAFDRLLTGASDAQSYDERPVLTKAGEAKLIAWHHTILHDEAGEVVGTLSDVQLGVGAPGLVTGQPHPERAGLDPHELHADGVRDCTLLGGVPRCQRREQ